MTTLKRADGTRFKVRDNHEVRCDIHGVITTWGALDGLQRQCVIDGLDVDENFECLLSPNRRTGAPKGGVE